jgi:hypothetical protein
MRAGWQDALSGGGEADGDWQPVSAQRALQARRVLQLVDGDVNGAVDLPGHRPGGQLSAGAMAARMTGGQ